MTSTTYRTSRRRILSTVGGLAAMSVAGSAAGCKVQTTSPESKQNSGEGFTIPDPKVTLPEGKVTFRWIDGGSRKAFFEKALFAAYHAKHPNITIDYTAPEQSKLGEVIPLGIRNGTAPDVFQIPKTVPPATAVAEGWVQPIQDLIPDFDTWRKAFPDGTLVPGTHILDGKMYSFPVTSDRQLWSMLWYDTVNLEKGGVSDPGGSLKSWDQFRDAAKSVTKAGKGKVYGLLADGLGTLVQGLAVSAGWNVIYDAGAPLTGMDPTTGRFAFSAQPMLDAVELALAIKSDGSILPGFNTLTGKQAAGRFPNSVAGMMVRGPWNYPDWENDAPNWKFGVLPLPTPDGSGTYFRNFTQTDGNCTSIYAKTKYPEIAADLYSYIGSLDGQVQLVAATRGALLPILPDAWDEAKKRGVELDTYAEQIVEMSKSRVRIGPSASIRNQQTATVLLHLKKAKPGFAAIMEGLVSGQVKDAKTALTKLDSASDKALDDAIAAAKKKGAEVSRDDYVFPNFDPSKDYTQADYDQL